MLSKKEFPVDIFLQNFPIKKDNLIALYPYGSRIYGTAEEKSDYDFLAVLKNIQQNNFSKEQDFSKIIPASKENSFENEKIISLHCIDQKTFQNALNQNILWALECVFLPKDSQILSQKWLFDIELGNLRSSASEWVSNSFVKAKKKITLHNEIRIGKKSLFHSLRMITFAIDIAKNKKITCYHSANHFYNDIFSEKYKTWNDLEIVYKPILNTLSSEFRKLAPKKRIIFKKLS